ncbi:MAG: sigma-70 family RNA polymerase sigma factor [Sediminibacterium sp.]|nr:sigma-70 family RNA polymerase sigma factor [Sediminibacterium sp.]
MNRESEFIALLEAYQRIVKKVCRIYAHTTEDRNDLFQEIALQAWRSFPRFRGDAQFSTWLYRVSLNTAITFYRKEQKKTSVPVLSDEFVAPASELDPREEQLESMYRAISTLSELDKAIVLLYLEDYPYDDIGQMMGITPNHVAVKMSRIKIKLQSLTQASPNQ